MKKILFALCFLFLTTPFSVFAQEKETNDYFMETINDYRVLHSGYYIYYDEDSFVREEQIFGDAVSYWYPNDTFSMEKRITFDLYQQHLPIDLKYEKQIRGLIEYANTDCTCDNLVTYGRDGVLLIKVNSGALLAQKNLGRNTLYGFTIPQDSSSLSGGKIHMVDITHPLTLEQIKKRYTFEDNSNQTITTEFYSNYQEPYQLGSYYILIVATDAHQNQTLTVDEIIVKDLKAPTLTLKKDHINIEVYEEFTSEQALELFSYYDNYDLLKDLKTDIVDQYQSNYRTLGTYTISMKVYDKSFNYSEEKTLTIEVVDTTAPNVQIKDNHTEIISDHPLNEKEIKEWLIFSDNYYPCEQLRFELLQNADNQQVGTMSEIHIAVTDPSGNRTEMRIPFYLTDTEKPIIMVKDTLSLEELEKMTNQELLEFLKQRGYYD